MICVSKKNNLTKLDLNFIIVLTAMINEHMPCSKGTANHHGYLQVKIFKHIFVLRKEVGSLLILMIVNRSIIIKYSGSYTSGHFI